jgi:FMN-dependent NADH-azoreductase
MKTLLVRYTPTHERSKTKALLDALRQEIKNSEVEELDLCIDVPDLFTPERMEAFYARYVLRTIPRDTPIDCLAKMDRMTAQVRSADVVALAFPMHNFSTPAPVKAWFDSIIRSGETFDRRAGKYVGLMTGKRAIVMVAAGGVYSRGDGEGPRFGPAWEYALRLAQAEFRFMGFSDVRGVLAEGQVIGDAALSARLLGEAVERVRALARAWYPSAKVRPEPSKAA